MRNAPKLDARLAAAAALVPQGSRVADVGCDHGLLSIWLAKQGGCKAVIACDLREKPLGMAKKNCAIYECEHLVDCRLGDGLSAVQPHEVDTIILAGISAYTITAILAAADWVKHPSVCLVLVPATKPERLRRWLWENGFALEQENLACAAGKWYTAIAATFDGQQRTPNELECVLGLTREQAGFAEYAQQESVKLAKYRKSVADATPQAQELDALLPLLQN